MIDSLGGPVRVNNVLSTLNLKTINVKNLKSMENRAGRTVEMVSKESTHAAANEAFKQEMEYVFAHSVNKFPLYDIKNYLMYTV